MIVMGCDPSNMNFGLSTLEVEGEEFRVVDAHLHPHPFQAGRELYDRKRRHVGYEVVDTSFVTHFHSLFKEFKPDLVVWERFQNRVLTKHTEPILMATGMLVATCIECRVRNIGVTARRWKNIRPLTKDSLASMYNDARQRIRERFKAELRLASTDPSCKDAQAMVPHLVDASCLGAVGGGVMEGNAGLLIRQSLPYVSRSVADIIFDKCP